MLAGERADERAGEQAGERADERADERAGVRAGVQAGVLADTLVDVSDDSHDYHFRLNLIHSIEMIHLHDLMVVLCADVCFGYQYCYRDPGGVDDSVDHDCHDVDDAHRIVVVHFHDYLVLDAHFDKDVAVLEFGPYV